MTIVVDQIPKAFRCLRLKNNLSEAIPLDQLRDKNQHVRAKQKEDFDRRHRVREMPTLPIGQAVYIADRQEYGRVVVQASSSRSYYINTPTGSFCRNRRKLIPMRDDAATIPEDDEDIVIPEQRNIPNVSPNEAIEDPLKQRRRRSSSNSPNPFKPAQVVLLDLQQGLPMSNLLEWEMWCELLRTQDLSVCCPYVRRSFECDVTPSFVYSS